MNNLRIIFMGTPNFAVTTLQTLIENNFNIVAVITAPDKAAGRGRKIQTSAVKEYALKNNLEILQPTNLKDKNFLNHLKSLNANLQIVVAFRMLPKEVWQMPKLGTFNLHASLLPNYRGAAPIHWAIINGETQTGVTTFFIDEKIDTGNIILQEKTSIKENTTVGELHDKLMHIGSNLVITTTKLIAKGNIDTKPQNQNENLREAPKIYTKTCKINWGKPINKIYNLIRGLNPYPTAWTTLYNNNKQLKLKIFDIEKEITNHKLKIGEIKVSKNEIRIAVAQGFIKILSLQIEGKKKMKTKDLLNGYTFYPNSKVN